MIDLGIRFEPPDNVPATNMLSLAAGLESRQWQTKNNLAVFPPKSIETILAYLDEGRSAEISILDWVHLFSHKGEWDNTHAVNEQRIADTSVRIFDAISQDKHVAHLALFRAALAVEGNEALFAPILLEYIDLLRPRLSAVYRILLDIIVAGRDGDFRAIGLIAMERNLLVHQLFNKLGLPRCTRLRSESENAVPQLVELIDIQNSEPWLTLILKEEPYHLVLKVLENLLKAPAELKSCSQILSWIEDNCHPRNEDSFWYRISDASKKSIRTLVKVSEFYRFQQMVHLLRSEPVANRLGLDEKLAKQIRARSTFWSHYQSSMLSVRMCLPKPTADLMDSHLDLGWFDIMSSENQSELIVMEFEEWIIAEVLRGTASEIRVFSKNKRNANILLRDAILAVDEIRKLHQDEVHDHAFCWQWACEEWLRKQCQITPDAGVVEFKGLPPEARKYYRAHGLQRPDDNMLRVRADELKSWSDSFFHRENNLGKYGKASAKVHEFLAKGKHYQRIGDKRRMLESYEQAANLGDKAAMILLGRYFLAVLPGSREEREKGELWLKKGTA
jgi:hypothetical protein